MPGLFLEPYARLLLVLHALLGCALGGVSIHLSLVALRFWRGHHHLARLMRVYANTGLALFVASMGAGLLLYPLFRYQVRALYLDRYEPWASGVFDFKENAAALALPLIAVVFVGGRKASASTSPTTRAVIAGASFGVTAAVTWALVAGLWVTAVKGP